MNDLSFRTEPPPETSLADRVQAHLSARDLDPLLICGDARAALADLPDASIDFAMTSPPYWGQRDYGVEGIGREATPRDYVDALVAVFAEVHRVLKPTGSLWLNLGDAYKAKSLQGLPWRTAIRLTDEVGYILRNEVIWHKVKGGLDQSKDKLRNTHEHLFHFTKSKTAYYDADALRSAPRGSKVVGGRVVSATGVSGVRYRRQIELSAELSEAERAAAFAALEAELGKVARGEIADFRMIIRGTQRATHSDGEEVSGRARELRAKGFYILRYHPNGAKMGDVWDIIPEDTRRSHGHFAAYPEDLCRRPIACSCPVGGVVLDPFCGTGTTMRVARLLGRPSIGIDLSPAFIELAKARCAP